MPAWTYDESRHTGINYADRSNAEKYDEQHSTFRDYQTEFEEMLAFLHLEDPGRSSVIDLGCGTGAMSLYAARRFGHVTCVDVSEAMLQELTVKIAEANLTNMTVTRAGFLSYRHTARPADLVVSKYAFHHLPDFWKQIALFNINRMLKSGGILYLCDVIFTFDPLQHDEKIGAWIDWFIRKSGKEFASEAVVHIRDEFSTFAWILDGMLERAGFEIVQRRSSDGFSTEYHCVKVRGV
jgi:ubiquinone/menaquinone biosynthesis C-methylase UbiE